KITNGQFCSTAHRKAYWSEQERLAVERLHQTHDSLRAYRPQGNVEAILGQTEPEPEAQPAPALTLVEMPQPEERPWWLPQVNAGQLPVARYVPDPTPLRLRWIQDSLAGSTPVPVEYSNPVRRPFAVYPAYDCGFSFAPPVFPAIVAAEPRDEESSPEPLTIAMHPVHEMALTAAPETPELNYVEPEPDPAPLAETLFALAAPQSR